MERREKITLDLEIYDIVAIDESIKDFSDVCSINKISTDKAMILEFEIDKDTPKNIELEFANYVLAAMQNR